MKTIHYKAQPTVAKYIKSDTFVNLIVGPIGSGKTLGSIIKWQKLISEQEPSEDGIRYTRTVVVRNTYTELKDTTIKSFTGWFGDLLKMNWGNLTAVFKHGDIHAEILFRSLDKPDDMKKLLSLELTYAYLNELRELPSEALTNVTSRLGRYPSVSSGIGATKPQCWADSNACDNEHWMYKKFFEKRPDNHTLFLQPPAILDDGEVNPEAENLDNLPYEYYRGFIKGKPQDWIDVMIRVKFIPLQQGKPVYPEYNDRFHCIDEKNIQPPNKDLPLVCGGDNGRTSGFLIAQMDKLGRLVIFDELISEDMGSAEFGEVVANHLKANYAGYKHEIFLDPAANSRTQLDDRTQVMVWRNCGLSVRTASTNKPSVVIEAVKKKLNTILQGYPSIVISSKCSHLRKALNGSYQYKRINVSGERYAEVPDKNSYSHICFIAGTKVTTIEGFINIEDIRVGTYVSTPIGNKKVIAIGSMEADVITIDDVTCTTDHPFYTTKGYVKADTLKYLIKQDKDILWTIHWLLKEREESMRCIFSMVKDIIDVETIMLMKKLKDCILMCGNIIMEKYHKTMIFTIKTLTRLIMPSATLSVCQEQNTIGCTCLEKKESKSQEKVLRSHSKQPTNGTEETPAKEESLHTKHNKLHFSNGIQEILCQLANGVVKNMQSTHPLKVEAHSNSVRQTVILKVGKQAESTMRSGLVLFVGLLLKLTSTLKRKHVAGYARRKAEVFNITVEDAHCYYANGYLVSNCDALAYLVDGVGGTRELISSSKFKEYAQNPPATQNWSVYDA
jgi:hypothetical protein